MADRKRELTRILERLTPGLKVVLTTHVNADGDGAGSEAALASWLRRRGLEPVIVNPTPFPDLYAFLLNGTPACTPADEAAATPLREADFFMVLDTAEPSRLGTVHPHLAGREVLTIDHHPPAGPPLGEISVRDPSACATGELVHDLFALAGMPASREEADALYVAIVTDTGSFRYANTNPPAHRIAAELIETGVDPESMYRRLYATYTADSLALTRRALEALQVHPELPVAWISLTPADMELTGAGRDDLDAIVEYPRRLQGVEVAILFRVLPDGRTKVSLRSAGDADVAAVARELGGGGHVKAAGALVPHGLDATERLVLEAIGKAL
ncbi:MAG: bifunctional oligoribonuclease/PAP phosphatase NrnA [marine benthic group bacterium]|nr:bifunctional oligoribonuclease/PAP phosphatase NrnA [Gemmatimonadota bacterium]MCL7962691.1 bifunctional oligoribonuclease/PAP phosphatase NrnA [Candidatus Carthagonibacter metallireducens]MCL7964071.1 bifunctional oligoribonuclease/PAP phosphatase NrnA [Gemmatimonadota bacterium]MCL7966971.1 bifunctional oligoribonuclease/PAP phosphatase NrnA [Gemmatimonadota bacterium]MCL7968046.1 bifunctional oligoribonuclease/PAP phosphatase NrnA [Gemmatimonadota bacterium]